MIEYEDLRLVNAPFRDDLLRAAERVIDSGWYVLGREVAGFEEEFAAYEGAAACVAVANGLDALALSLRALEMPPASEVLVASNTYIATILAILHAGHVPVLVEPDIRTYNIDPAKLAGATSVRTRAICVTHLYGKSCEMTAVMDFAAEHGLHVIEDCAQSHGARHFGRLTGTFGIAGCFSFYPTKNLGALGDAGAVVTDDLEFADKLRYWRNYGSRQKYVNRYAGFNSRMDEMQAALLRVKLQKLDALVRRKRSLAEIYFTSLPRDLVLPSREDHSFDTYHIFAIRHPKRDALRQKLLEMGVKSEIHYPIPPHRQEAMSGLIAGEYPCSEEIHGTILSLPISYATAPEEVEGVCRAATAAVATL